MIGDWVLITLIYIKIYKYKKKRQVQVINKQQQKGLA
jgi:hypothetical protein